MRLPSGSFHGQFKYNIKKKEDMERMNNKIPFEHQMMFIIKDYDRKVEEIHELRKELDELSKALEEFGGRGDRACLKNRCSNLKDKVKSLEGKLKKRTEAWETERREKARYNKQAKILEGTLRTCQNQLHDLLKMVEVPKLRKMANKIAVVLAKYKKEASSLQEEDHTEIKG